MGWNEIKINEDIENFLKLFGGSMIVVFFFNLLC